MADTKRWGEGGRLHPGEVLHSSQGVEVERELSSVTGLGKTREFAMRERKESENQQ